MTSAPEPCPICGAAAVEIVHDGPVRAGVFGTQLPGRVLRCSLCRVDRLQLAEGGGLDDARYRSGEYRELVGETRRDQDFLALHDVEQPEKLPLVAPHLRRGAIVADVGCGGGSFLDLVKGLAGTTIAVELTETFHAGLAERGHRVFSTARDCAARWKGKVDLAVSFSVIEHVPHPVQFLADIAELLAPGGVLVLSTPNRDDVLLKQGLPEYRAFFYRQVHSFYFDAPSLRTTCERAGLEVREVHHHQRFGFTNFANWLAERRPTGRALAPLVSDDFDRVWKTELERHGLADYLYFIVRRK
jgi:SAM-dependent methyltransferase